MTIMRITIFADVDNGLNPYVLLFQKTLDHLGFTVSLESRLSFKWLLTKGYLCDCIHLQWINQAYTPLIPKISSYSINRIFENRGVRALLQTMRLIHFSSVLLLARLFGKTIVYTVHNLDVYQNQSLRGTFLITIAHQLVFRLSNSIHVHNQYSRQIIKNKYNIRKDVSVIPHGNYIGYYPNQIKISDARRQLGLPMDSFVYLFLGLLRPYKGLKDLIAAFHKLEIPDLRLVIAGMVFKGGNFETELKKKCQKDSRINLVTEFIPDEDVQLYLRACDIVVLPYKHITTSGAAALALSFGRPIIAPAIASFPELITSESGILYNSSEPNGLFFALREGRTRSWSEKKILDYAYQFNWDKLGLRIAALYKKNPAA